MGKTNWKDIGILKIISNEVYKGDYVHGKRTNYPTYYDNVVNNMYECNISDDDNIEELDLSKEKDDFER